MRLVLLISLVPAIAFAQVNVCGENFLECNEDCSLEHSSIRAEAAKTLEKCLKKCRKKRALCEERELETKAGQLDHDALEKPKRELDEMGMPKKKEPVERTSPGDDLRDDGPRAEPEETPEPAPKRSRKAPPTETSERKRPKEELKSSEVPRSSRTELKVEESKPVETKVKEPEPRPSEEPIVMTPKAERRRDDDLRDDRPAPREEPPPSSSSSKKKRSDDDLPPPKAKPKEEDHDDLRNY